MAPKSKTDSTAPESTVSRRSARLASAPVSESVGQKRGASAPKSGPASKKTKMASTASESKKTGAKAEKIDEEKEDDLSDAPDVAAKPNGKKVGSGKGPKAPVVAEKGKGDKDSKTDKGDTKKTAEKAEKAEKEAEAPKSAKADTGGKGAIKLGDGLPKITVQNHKGEDVMVGDLGAGGRGVVLFLFPKADTPGCTNQACGYRDAHDEIKELGYDIYGLSKDKPAAQQKWATKKELTYTLLCDPESKLIKKLGAFVLPNNTKRSHFIFEKDTGKLVDLQLGVKPADDPSNCVKFIKQHHK